MKERYLEVTFRKGKPLAAYLYLPRKAETKSARTESAGSGLLIDYASDGRPIGLEITAPQKITAADINNVLQRFNQPPVIPEDLAPLSAA
jgi:uncharacterized protein YuzE